MGRYIGTHISMDGYLPLLNSARADYGPEIEHHVRVDSEPETASLLSGASGPRGLSPADIPRGRPASGAMIYDLIQFVVLTGSYSILPHLEPVARFAKDLPWLPWTVLANVVALANFLTFNHLAGRDSVHDIMRSRGGLADFREAFAPYQITANRFVLALYTSHTSYVADLQACWVRRGVRGTWITTKPWALPPLPNPSTTAEPNSSPGLDSDESDADQVERLWRLFNDNAQNFPGPLRLDAAKLNWREPEY
jgi:hypothetical protein